MSTHKNPKQQSGRPLIDPLLTRRLEQSGGRPRTGSPLPPPVSGAAAKPQRMTVISTEPTSKRIPIQGTNAAQTQKLQAAAARSAAARAASNGGKAAPTTGRRAKPATASKIASLAVSIATTAFLAGLFARNDSAAVAVTLTGGTDAAGPNSKPSSTNPSNSTASTGVAKPGASTPTTAAVHAPVSAVVIKNGTYVGQTQYNRFGPVQVQAVYVGGKLTDVQILQYEDGDNRSIRINQIALPRLIQQSLQAQGTKINGVSGATYTGRSYVKSLQSAIDAAKQASGVTG